MHQRSAKRRYFIRTEEPRKGLRPIGLLGLLLLLLPLLYLFFSYAKNNIEENTRSSVKQSLLNMGLDWVKVDADGQFVSLTGNGSTEDAKQALSLAKTSKSQTWFGELTTPISVEVDFKPKERPAPENLKLTEKPESTAIEPENLVWGNVKNTLADGVLSLQGSVGDPREKRALIQAGKNTVYKAKAQSLNHNVEVKQKTVEGSLELAMLSSSLLSFCQSGESATKEGVLSLNCNATAEGASAIDALKSEPLAYGEFGEFTVNVVGACKTPFAEAVDITSIHFEDGSNVLPESSNEQFDRIAEWVRECPTLLRIDGHTSDTGNHDFNMNLSFRRAMAGVEALVARGVKRELLVPYAYGPNRPRSLETTESAKANNRRIEIQLFNQGAQ